MTDSGSGGREQVAVDCLLDAAYEDFDNSLLSASARFILWGSFSSAENLAENYFRAKSRSNLLDRRRTDRSLSSEEVNERNRVYSLSEEASEFVQWARNRINGQPILREALVSYCVSMESALKNVSLAFRLAHDAEGFQRQIFVTERQFRDTLDRVKKDWRQLSEGFRAREFYEQHIFKINPDKVQYPFQSKSCDEAWAACGAAFDLRNAIVHQMGRLSQQISLRDDCFPARSEIELNTGHLRTVSDAMREIMKPISPYRIDLL